MATVKQTSIKITQELGKLERALTPKLKRFYNQYIKNSQQSIYQIRQVHGQSLENEIRNTVESSWLFSNQIMEERTLTVINTSIRDIQGIEKITSDMTNQFWVTSQKLLTRETEFKLSKDQELIKLQPFDIPVAMVGLSGLFAYLAFNTAMTSKSDELGLNMKLRFTVRSDCIDTKMCRPLEGRLFEKGNIPDQYQPPLHRHCHCHLIPIVS